MLVELVDSLTSDGMRLEGAFRTPAEGAVDSLSIDAAICLHGVGGNFYSSSLMSAISDRLADGGAAVLRVNTRGHDGIHTATVNGRGRRQGAAYEIVDECRLDIAAWHDFLLSRGYRKLAVIGHSLGAIKAVYAQSQEPLEAVSRIAAISPPRLCCSLFRAGESSSVFFESLSTAQRLVDNGQSEALFEARFPFPLIISAAAYVDKYGPAERYDIVKLAPRLTCPTLYTFGQLELAQGGVAFVGLDEQLGRLTAQHADVATIAGANHFYHGVQDALADVVVEWLGRGE